MKLSDKQKAANRRGGKAYHAVRGLSSVGIEDRIRIAKMGAKASNSGHKKTKKSKDPFDVI